MQIFGHIPVKFTVYTGVSTGTRQVYLTHVNTIQCIQQLDQIPRLLNAFVKVAKNPLKTGAKSD